MATARPIPLSPPVMIAFFSLGMRTSARRKLTLGSQRRRFRVRAAFFAAAERERAERCPATRFACLDNACVDAERRLSRLSACLVARERFTDGFLRLPARPFVRSRFAWRFGRCLPRFVCGNFTP